MPRLTSAAVSRRPCLLVLLVCLAFTLPARAADKVALVIGNASYEVGRLANPVNDATDMAAALRAKEFDVTLATNVNRDGMLEQVEAFRRKIRPGGIALVFFAGHAVEHRGENWLLPVENGAIRTQAHVSIHSVSAQDVLSMIEERGARLNILVLDACRDNPLPAGARSAQRGLAAIDTGTSSSSLVAFATSPNRTAADGEGRNSPYTAALLRGLRDPSLSVTDLFNKVGAEVMQATGGAQVPWNSNTPIWPAIYLAGEAPRRIEPQPVRPQTTPQPAQTPEPQNQAAEAEVDNCRMLPLGRRSEELPSGTRSYFWGTLKSYQPVYSDGVVSEYDLTIDAGGGRLHLLRFPYILGDRIRLERKIAVAQNGTSRAPVSRVLEVLDARSEGNRNGSTAYQVTFVFAGIQYQQVSSTHPGKTIALDCQLSVVEE